MTKPNPDEKLLDELIDTALHPERNGLLIKEKVAEGASHEWLVKRELKTAILSEFFSKDKVREAIGEDEPLTTSSAYDAEQAKRAVESPIRNGVRAEIRSKLGIEDA